MRILTLVRFVLTCFLLEMVKRELRTLKMMNEEVKKYPEFYSPVRVKLLVALFDHIDVDNSGTLSFEEVGLDLDFRCLIETTVHSL